MNDGNLNEIMKVKQEEHLKHTKSVCPFCLSIIDADVKVRDGKVIITKTCRKHGNFEDLHLWDDPWVYKKMEKILSPSSNHFPLLLNFYYTENPSKINSGVFSEL